MEKIDKNKTSLKKELVDENLIEKTTKKESRQLKMIIIIMLFCLLLLTIPFIYQFYISNFTYENIKFHMTKQAGKPFYSALIPVLDAKGNQTGTYLMTFRNDPRVMDNIPVIYFSNETSIKFVERNTVFVSIDPEMKSCDDNSLSMFELGAFLKDSKLNVKSAMTDEKVANESGFAYIDCLNSSFNTIIVVKSGEESGIEQKLRNCFVISYKDCEINAVVERFILEIIKNYYAKNSL